MISLIAAVAQNGVIGNKNAMPWNLPRDFQWFKEKTLGKQLIVGRKTFDSIGRRPLSGRTHVILTRQRGYEVPKICTVVHSINEAVALMPKDEEVMVCGGGMIYDQFLPMARRIYLTKVRHSFSGDVFFPAIKWDDWREIAPRQYFEKDAENAHAFTIIALERKA